MTTHPTSDLMIRIKNGYGARREEISTPHSKLREEILKKLLQLHLIKGYDVVGEGAVKEINIQLEYDISVPAVTDLKLFSTPGRRWYITVAELKPVMGGIGYSILSTPLGILTHVEAKKNNVGGELLFNIW